VCNVSDSTAIKLQNLTFFHASLAFSIVFGITGYCNLRRFRRAGSQDTNPSCHVPISTFCCTTWSQSTYVTYRDSRSDGRHACSI